MFKLKISQLDDFEKLNNKRTDFITYFEDETDAKKSVQLRSTKKSVQLRSTKTSTIYHKSKRKLRKIWRIRNKII